MVSRHWAAYGYIIWWMSIKWWYYRYRHKKSFSRHFTATWTLPSRLKVPQRQILRPSVQLFLNYRVEMHSYISTIVFTIHSVVVDNKDIICHHYKKLNQNYTLSKLKHFNLRLIILLSSKVHNRRRFLTSFLQLSQCTTVFFLSHWHSKTLC